VAERHDPITGQVKEPRGWRFYVLATAGVLLLILVAQNLQQVQLDFLFIHTQTPLIVALVIAGALGALIGWALPHVRRSRRVERERDQPHD
jgi:uncharacterized integral membrane protein